MSTNSSNDRASLCAFTRQPPVPHAPPRRPPVPLRLPCSQRSASSRRGNRRPGYCLSPLRELSLRLRPNLRPRPTLLRRRPRPAQTQNRLHLGLSLGQTLAQTLHLAQDEYINA